MVSQFFCACLIIECFLLLESTKENGINLITPSGTLAILSLSHESKETKIEYNALTKLIQTCLLKLALKSYLPTGVFITLNLASLKLFWEHFSVLEQGLSSLQS